MKWINIRWFVVVKYSINASTGPPVTSPDAGSFINLNNELAKSLFGKFKRRFATSNCCSSKERIFS